MNYPIEIPESLFAAIKELLETGKVSSDNYSVDFTKLQNVNLAESNMLVFDPPVVVSVKLGMLNLRTTVSSLTAVASGIKIEVDNSPVNLELKPK